MPSTLIVVLNWNGIEDTLVCVDSLLRQTYENFKILIVDNNSTDGSKKRLKSYQTKHKDIVEVIYNPRNLGFAGGVNTGIRYALAHGFYSVALFNNDARANKDWLEQLAKHLKKDTAAVTGLLLHEDGQTIDSTGDYYSIWGMPFPRSRGMDPTNIPPSGYVFSGSGGATLYRTDLFRDIGLFDESFFAYYEDIDVSFRAQLAGNKVYFTSKAVAYHKQGATSSKMPGFTIYQTFKNIPLLYIKNIPLKFLLSIGLRLFILYWLIFGNAVKNGAGAYALKGWLASIWYFWTQAIWQRFHIQRKRVVSNKYLSDMLWRDLPPDQTGMKKLFRRS